MRESVKESVWIWVLYVLEYTLTSRTHGYCMFYSGSVWMCVLYVLESVWMCVLCVLHMWVVYVLEWVSASGRVCVCECVTEIQS